MALRRALLRAAARCCALLPAQWKVQVSAVSGDTPDWFVGPRCSGNKEAVCQFVENCAGPSKAPSTANPFQSGDVRP